MDPLIAAAARALAAGDPIGALNRVALREDARGLALRGVAMAQLGEFPRAKALLRRAARGFGPGEPVARARCVVAEAEIALAARDLAWPPGALDAARASLEAHGDRANAAHARLIAARRHLLLGRLTEAERMLAAGNPVPLPPPLRAVHELAVAGIAMRRLRAREARAALARADGAARRAGVPALQAEVAALAAALAAPAARLVTPGTGPLLSLEDIEALLASGTLVVDGCRHVVARGTTRVALAGRPVLFALARTLGEAWPGDASRAALLRSFGAHFTDASHRARLRVEISRLRRALGPLAAVAATPAGFTLAPRRTDAVAVLAPPAPVPARHGAVFGLLADGEGWSSSALALAPRTSPRTVQRALEALATAGLVQGVGRGRARRWMASPVMGIATSLLLPAPLPLD